MNINIESKRSIKMKGFKKFNLLQLLVLMNILFSVSVSEEIHCGNIRIQEPFLHQNSSNSPLLSQIILCKSEKLYFRTSIGLFQISSIDYNSKFITVSHTCCSPTSNFVSPHHLSAGFPPPSKSSNSLILFNCSNLSSETPLVPCNNNMFSGFCDSSTERVSSCSMTDDVEKLDKNFDPKQMNCTRYSRVYTSSSENKVELGTSISFDIPDHVPNPCDECEKRDGNCGVGLRCACHPKKCKDKVTGAAMRTCGNIVVFMVFFTVVVVFLHGP